MTQVAYLRRDCEVGVDIKVHRSRQQASGHCAAPFKLVELPIVDKILQGQSRLSWQMQSVSMRVSRLAYMSDMKGHTCSENRVRETL